MAGPPRVSVIITTRNRAGLLPRAVESVLSQTLKDFELIVVDDASTDDTPRVIESFADARIRPVRQDINIGQFAARAVGLRMARGEYVAFLDDDDERTPDSLEVQSSLLDADPNVGVVYGWREEVNDETGHRRIPGRQNTHRGRSAFDAALAGLSPSAAMPFPMFRAEALRRLAWPRRPVTLGEDAILMGLVTRDWDADVVERAVVVTHIHHAYKQISHSIAREDVRNYVDLSWELFGNDLRERPGAEAEWRAGNAKAWMMARAPAPALRELCRAMRLRPFDAANARWAAAVFAAFLLYAAPMPGAARRARNLRSRMFGVRGVTGRGATGGGDGT